MFILDGIIFDRIQTGVAESLGDDMLYTLANMSDATIETTSDSKEAKDKDGVLIKKIYQAKAATLKGTNTLMDWNIYGEQTGSGKIVASSEAPIQMPKIVIVDSSVKTVSVKDAVEGTIKVASITGAGSLQKNYTQAAAASATEFGYATNTVTLPTGTDATQFMVKYERKVTSGAMVENRADKFPDTIKLTLKALCFDPCTPATVRACYIVFPSFQLSPETSAQLTTDATFEFNGDAQVDYCNPNKRLYYICMAEDDIEAA